MAETAPTSTVPDTSPTTDSATEKVVDHEAEAKKWKALARQNEAKAKANAEAATKLAEIEDKDKSELERLTARAAEAERRVAEADLRALRIEVAADKGLSPAQAKRLQGNDRAELEADADELLEAFTPEPVEHEEPDTTDTSTKPKAKLKPGRIGDDAALNGDPLLSSLKSKLGIS